MGWEFSGPSLALVHLGLLPTPGRIDQIIQPLMIQHSVIFDLLSFGLILRRPLELWSNIILPSFYDFQKKDNRIKWKINTIQAKK